MYKRKRHLRAWAAIPAAMLIVAISVIAGPTASAAYTTQVSLGVARPFAVLAAAAVTADGSTTINGNLGWGTAYSPPAGFVSGNSIGPLANWLPERDAMTAAYNDANTRTSLPIAAELGGTTQLPGVYSSIADVAFAITTPLTLDADFDPNAVFIFKTGPTAGLNTTASVGNVLLINGAQACNVFWQVGGAATLGATTSFKGNILAYAAITAGAGTTIDGRAFSVTAAVTLDANTVGGCDIVAPTITAPTDVVTVTGPGATLCSAVVANGLLTAIASDNSGTVTVTRVPAGNTFAVGATTVTYTASDLAGNTASATNLVTVTDNTVPTITAPADAGYQFLSNVPVAGSSDATGVFDNCGAPTVTFAQTNDGGAGTLGFPLTITRTYTATDSAGNTSSEAQTIRVEDTTAAPTPTPTVAPSSTPTPTIAPTIAPTPAPTVTPTPTPTIAPTPTPTVAPTPTPTPAPAALAPVVPAAPQVISTLFAEPFDVLLPISALDVGTTAAQVPVAVVTIPRLPATSTSRDFEPLEPVNFVQGFALGFALVLIGGLLFLGSRKSV